MLSSSAPARRHKPLRRLWQGGLLVLLFWIAVDVFVPVRHSIRRFDPAEVARLETAMWRSYYDRKPVLLFWQLAGGLRQQFRAPFWRSFGLAFQATRAAFVFKQGQSRADYERTLPILTAYYESIQNLSEERFDIPRLAALELEWWIVHRQRDQYSYADLATALAQTAAVQYNQPTALFAQYGWQRAEAMRLCDEVRSRRGTAGVARPELAGRQAATEADWQRIEQELNRAWNTLNRIVQQ